MENEFEADVIAAMLDEENIPNQVISHASLAYDGLFQMTLGWGHLEVPEEFQEKTLKLIDDYKESLPEV